MSDEDLAETLRAMEEQDKENLASPEKAKAALVRWGILTEQGELDENYR